VIRISAKISSFVASHTSYLYKNFRKKFVDNVLSYGILLTDKQAKAKNIILLWCQLRIWKTLYLFKLRNFPELLSTVA